MGQGRTLSAGGDDLPIFRICDPSHLTPPHPHDTHHLVHNHIMIVTIVMT